MARSLDLNDFSGGLREGLSPGEFTSRQWSQLHGFVLESETELRSQWQCQRVSQDTDIAAVRGFTAQQGRYLVAIRNDGTITWAEAPDRLEGNDITTQVTWTDVTAGTLTNTDTAVAVPANTAYRFICEVQILDDNTAYRSGLLVHALSGDSPAVVLVEGADGLIARCWTDHYPKVYLDGQTEVAWPNVIPRANVGCVWGNFLVLGDIEWVADANLKAEFAHLTWTISDDDRNAEHVTKYQIRRNGTLIATVGLTDSFTDTDTVWSDTELPGYTVTRVWFDTAPEEIHLTTTVTAKMAKVPFGPNNRKRYRNALWISTVDDNGVPAIDRFHPVYSVNTVGTPEATIRGLQVIDRGLLVFTTSATDNDGVILLRGTAPTGDGSASYVPVVLRGGMGAAAETADRHHPYHTMWSEAGSVVFVEDKGTIWHTNGLDIGRLDRYGATPPSAANQADHVACVGPYLFVARDSRLLVMRMFDEDGAWTELNFPGAVESMAALEDCLYFVSPSQGVFRFNLAVDSRRGYVDDQVVPLTVSTAVVGDPLAHDRKAWFRVGARVSGQQDEGFVVEVISRAGSPLIPNEPAASHTTVLNRPLAWRDEILVRGHGPSTEASATLVFNGDVIIESVSLWTHGREPSR
jgi:hypothetical protein